LYCHEQTIVLSYQDNWIVTYGHSLVYKQTLYCFPLIMQLLKLKLTVVVTDNFIVHFRQYDWQVETIELSMDRQFFVSKHHYIVPFSIAVLFEIYCILSCTERDKKVCKWKHILFVIMYNLTSKQLSLYIVWHSHTRHWRQ